MPIYEWNCTACDLSFEALASVIEANAPRACPECGEPAGRIISACVIGAGAPPETAARATSAPGGADRHAHQHGRQSPIPPPARLCWMDDKSAERFAAYKMGRGHQYDDKQAAIAERRKQRGEAEPKPDNTNSPVAQILARKKAREAKEAAKAAGASVAAANTGTAGIATSES
ncbi:MAG TPA: zinc ribbon domain-containing protein [Candidatus Binataceae bacterium]|nr:zinc ribbon domain-containing protein [Candidatus Binataceae bacterium]